MKFIMQMAYGDKKLFYKHFSLIIKKIDLLVEMPPEMEVLWFFSRVHMPRIFEYYSFLIAHW